MSNDEKDERIVRFSSGRVRVRRGGSYMLFELSCENCGVIPQEGDTRHVFWLESEQKAILTCEECYRELSAAFGRDTSPNGE